MQPPQSFIFIGRSGSGKGTQAELLMKRLEEKTGRKSLYVQTGGELRTFIQGQTHTQKLAKELYDTGALMAEFLTIDMWVRALVDNFTGEENVIFDGTPRKLHEAQVFNSIFSFYKLAKPWVIYIDVSPEESLKRLLARKREDDKEDEIKKRLSWFDTHVVPSIHYFETHPSYHMLRVNGERSPEDIHADIVKHIGL